LVLNERSEIKGSVVPIRFGSRIADESSLVELVGVLEERGEPGRSVSFDSRWSEH